jgi:hypothetical protein
VFVSTDHPERVMHRMHRYSQMYELP